ncbi:MAG: DUF2236 domain-containing protein [Anaerolineae bacterium]|jgi:hypothetical protein|nr:DUF2236 domain-containing protein [Anaerolineae bacterium]
MWSLWKNRYQHLREIETLDPEKDNQRIVYLAGTYEFPFATQRALELALFRTFAASHTAQLLDQTGQFQGHGQKRYDDTALIVTMIGENGYDSEAGRAAIRRMNQLHRRYNIANEDFLYTLAAFVLEPIHWNQVFGWRMSTRNERLANFYYWREVGQRMNIQDIPETLEELERFSMDYESKYFRYNEYSQRVGNASIEVFTRWFPAPFHPIVRRAIYALLDDSVREAFGFPRQPRWFRAAIFRLFRVRAWVIRHLMPPRRTPFLFTQRPSRTYPNGFTLDQIGSPERPN